ncbi:MAG: hypothetical protein AAF682_04740 [Planctomycetota bacterium]
MSHQTQHANELVVVENCFKAACLKIEQLCKEGFEVVEACVVKDDCTYQVKLCRAAGCCAH